MLDLQPDRDRAVGGQRGEGVGQPVVEHRRVDPAGQAAQLAERVLGAPQRGVDQLAGGRGVRRPRRRRRASPGPCRGSWPAWPAGSGRRRAGPVRAAAAGRRSRPRASARLSSRSWTRWASRPGPSRPRISQASADVTALVTHGAASSIAAPAAAAANVPREGRDAERAVAEQPERREHRHRAQPDPRRVVPERTPQQRVAQVDQPADPEEHGVQLDQADRQLGQLVGHDPPAGPVARPGPGRPGPGRRTGGGAPTRTPSSRVASLRCSEPSPRAAVVDTSSTSSSPTQAPAMATGPGTGCPARRGRPTRSGPRRQRRAPPG